MAVPKYYLRLEIVQWLLPTLPLLETTEQIVHSLAVIPNHLRTSLRFSSYGVYYLLITERVIDTGLEPALDNLTTFRSWGLGHHPALRSRSFAER